MVKFGKYLEINQNPEWRNNYINYGVLKTKIKDLKNLQRKEYLEPVHYEKTEQEIEDELNTIKKTIDKKLIDHLNNQLQNKSLQAATKIKIHFISVGKYVNEFLHLLDQEAQKFKLFYLNLEREIENDLRFLRNELDTLTNLVHIKEVIEFIDHMENSVNRVFGICQFVNMNITAIRKILKKFDKTFDNEDNPIALHYIKDNLTKKNSSLVYILKFKIIDEASALMDRMVKSLEKSIFKKISDTKKYKEEFLHEPLLLREINLEELSGSEIYKNINKVIRKKIERIKNKIERIDDANNLIRSGVEVWSLIIKSNIRVVYDYFESKAILHNANIEQTKEIYLKNLTPQLQKDEEKYHVTRQMKFNLFVALAHTFLYTMNCYIVQLTNGLYVAELGASQTTSGVIMGMTHLAAIFCTFMYSSWTNTTYKIPLIVSCILFILGNFTYSFADFNESLIIMAFGRFLIGLASARVVNRRYIIEQVPQHLIMHYSFLYVGLTCLGMASGPFIAMILMHLVKNEYVLYSLKFNHMTNPAWFSMIIWFIFFFVVLLGFKDPEQLTKLDNQNLRSMSLSESEVQESIQQSAINNTIQENNTADIEKDINNIIDEEENSYSYMSISFTILILILLIIRMTTESLCVLTPISMPVNFEVSHIPIAIFLSITAGIVFPITYLINMVLQEQAQRKVIFILLIICFVSCVFIINNPLFTVSLGRFIVFYTLLFVSCNILESVDSALMAQIFPSNLNLGFCNSGFTIILTTTGGKSIGSFLITVIGWFLELDVVYDCLISFYLVSYLALCILVYLNYSELRVKAIARILQKKEVEANK